MDPTYLSFFRFFGLRENPFNVNPDPGYLFLNQRTQNMLGDLMGAIEARKGLMVITGDVGTGKTTLLNYLMQALERQKTPTAFIFNPRLQVSELFDLMLANFSIPAGPGGSGSALLRLNQWLLERYRAGANAVLIIDEAQGLPAHVIEEIRMLLNQETPNEKLLQIILCGQPELEASLSRPELRQIRQRISLRCKMKSLSLEEAHGYIQKRLRIAGAPNAAIFLPEAVDAVHLCSRGIPRVMNLLCEHALMRAYVEQIRPVAAYLIEDVAHQLQLEDVRPADAPLASLLGNEAAIPAHRKEELQESVLTSPIIATHPVPCPMEEMALMAKDLVGESSPFSRSDAAELETVLSRRLRVVSSAAQDRGHSSKVMEMPRESGRKAAEGLPEEKTRQNTSRAARKEHKGTFAAHTLRSMRATAAAGLVDWGKRAVIGVREFLPRFRPIRDEVSRWYRTARQYFVPQEWEKNAESLVRWLQEPMSTVKFHRRMRH